MTGVDPDGTQTCDESVWVLSVRMMESNTFLVNDGREVSLVDHDTLMYLLRQRLEKQE